jgi:4-hydroxy-2-oxoheptanedioate aldolase
MRPNNVRELIKRGKPTFGTHIISPWPGMMEVVGLTKAVDYVEFSAEYAPFDLHDLDNLARASEVAGVSSMMKIDQEPRIFLSERALGSGIQNILFADVRSAADAELCVRAVKMDTPTEGGLHGCHMRRSIGYVVEGGTKDYVRAMNEAVIALMIEKKSAVDDLENVMAVKGVDMVQFGPCDYAISVGLPGEYSHEKVKSAELKVIRTALKMGIRPRVELGWGFSKKDVQKYADLGVKDFCIGADVQTVYEWVRENLSMAMEVLAG